MHSNRTRPCALCKERGKGTPRTHGLLVGETLSKIAGADRKQCEGPERGERGVGSVVERGGGRERKKDARKERRRRAKRGGARTIS